MSTWQFYEMVMEESDQERQRWVKKEELLRQMRTETGQTHPLYHRPLAWLARRLIAWGCCLQARYNPTVEAAANLNPDRAR